MFKPTRTGNTCALKWENEAAAARLTIDEVRLAPRSMLERIIYGRGCKEAEEIAGTVLKERDMVASNVTPKPEPRDSPTSPPRAQIQPQLPSENPLTEASSVQQLVLAAMRRQSKSSDAPTAGPAAAASPPPQDSERTILPPRKRMRIQDM